MRDQQRIFRAALGASATAFLLLGAEKGTYAQAPLPPGTTSGVPVPIINPGSPPFGDILLQEVTAPIFGTNILNTISGTVNSAVFRNASGFLDFAYQFTFNSTTNIVVDAISLSSFKNVAGLSIAQTDNDLDGPTGLFAQVGGVFQNNFQAASATGSYSSASRPNVNGDGISATLLTGVTGNQTTYSFLVRTAVTDYTLGGSASVQGGGISAFTPAQAALIPLAMNAPEPGTLALMFLGSLGLVARRTRRTR